MRHRCTGVVCASYDEESLMTQRIEEQQFFALWITFYNCEQELEEPAEPDVDLTKLRTWTRKQTERAMKIRDARMIQGHLRVQRERLEREWPHYHERLMHFRERRGEPTTPLHEHTRSA